MSEQIKNMLIGSFVVAAMGLVIAMVLFIKPSVGDGKQILNVRFSNINGISVGTRVIFAGKAIGEVKSIEILPNPRNMPSDKNGNIYYYNLILKIDSGIPVYTTDEFTTQTSGLLGDKSVAIIPKISQKGEKPKLLTSKSIIYADSNDLLENAYNILESLATKVEDAVGEVSNWIKKNGDNIGDAIVNFDSTMKEASAFIKTLNDENVICDVKNATESFTYTMDSINDAITTLDDQNAFDNASILISNLTETSKKIDAIIGKVADGDGTIGKLFNDDDTYLQISAVLSKVNTMMNDINQYGLLFNMNKKWQRGRTKQASFIDSLKTPNQFKNYFEGEIDQINTAMGRISLLIEKASNSPDREKILENPVFKSDFKSLMQQVDSLKDSIKLYNEYLNEASPTNP